MWQPEVDGIVTEEEWSHLPPFNALTVYWDNLVDAEYAKHFHILSTTGTYHEPPEQVSDEEVAPPPPPSCAGH